jgi:hypothetical protein
MDFRGYVPPGLMVGISLIAILGGSWVVVGLWWLSHHVSISFQ